MGELEGKVFMFVIVGLIAAGWVAVFIYVGKNKGKWSFGTVRAIQGVAVFLSAMVAVFAVGLSDINEPDGWYDQPTAERTPALIYPLLTAQTTADELRAAAEERELYAIPSSQSEGLYYVVVDTSYMSNRQNAGVMLEVQFSSETGAFSSAKLTIRTQTGTARCTAAMDKYGTMEYKIRVRTPWYALARTQTAADAQAALAIAYDAVYPDGM